MNASSRFRADFTEYLESALSDAGQPKPAPIALSQPLTLGSSSQPVNLITYVIGLKSQQQVTCSASPRAMLRGERKSQSVLGYLWGQQKKARADRSEDLLCAWWVSKLAFRPGLRDKICLEAGLSIWEEAFIKVYGTHPKTLIPKWIRNGIERERRGFSWPPAAVAMQKKPAGSIRLKSHKAVSGGAQ